MNAIRRGLAVSGFAVAVTSFGFADAQTKTYTVNADFDGGALTNVCHGPGPKSVCADPTPDQLVLGRTLVSKAERVWVDNYISGWVIGLDVTTGKQVSRFPSGLKVINGVSTGNQGVADNLGSPQPETFDTTPALPNPVRFNTQPPPLSAGGIQIGSAQSQDEA